MLIDCCEAGSFLDELTHTGTARRTVLVSCSSNEPTYFVSGGLVSFSDAFFAGVMMGLDVGRAFGLARDAMSTYQSALMDADNSGTYTPNVDENLAADIRVGASFVVGKDIPQIGGVSPAQTLSGTTRATLWAADIMSTYPIQRVWCLVVPPGHHPDPTNPVGDLPSIDLTYNSATRRYETDYSGFSQVGTFKLVFYAQDIWGSLSLPQQSYVTQGGFVERAILVTGGSTNGATWPGVNTMGRLAYHTFRSRWLDPSAIRYLSPLAWQDVDNDGTNDIAAVATVSNLQAAITTWAQGANKLTVYLIGDGSNNGFAVNGQERLDPALLKSWLDAFQTNGAEVVVVMDSPGAGATIPILTAPAGRTRTIIAASQAGQSCLFANKGVVSFSEYFLSDILSGFDLRTSFNQARDAIRQASGRLRQGAQLDDNGDGLANKADGAVAQAQYIGTAFITGSESPMIEAVTPDALLAGTNSLVLWASGVTDADGISNVWCTITPPDYDGTGDLPQTNLAWNDDSQRYEAVWNGFTTYGTYALSFYAMDSRGEVSPTMQSTVTLADAYEPDDSADQASCLAVGGTQRHNFHCPDDEDWVRFYCVSNVIYEIDANQVGTNAYVTLDLYWECPDGTLTNIDSLDSDGPGAGSGATTYIFKDMPEGFYLARARPADTNMWGFASDYDLRVWVPAGGGSLIVVALDKLNAGHPPPGAWVEIVGVGSQTFDPQANSVSFPSIPDGSQTVVVHVPSGYLAEEDPKNAAQINNPSSYYGNPKTLPSSDTTQILVFQFVPVAQMTGRVRDRLTGAWVDGATIAFTARNGLISNLVYDGYPAFTTYKLPWATALNGRFPTNVLLPTVDYDLRLTKPGYSNLVIQSAVTGLTAGTVVDLGNRWLSPVDANGNGIADAWETLYFGAGTNVNPMADADGDGVNNLAEYLAGTNPTNAQSALKLSKATAGSTNLTLNWLATPGRVYEVMGLPLPELVRPTPLWQLLGGPWTSEVGVTEMNWSAPAAASTGHVYRVELLPP